MESTLVIKVKYGDTLRRFRARVDENNRLDLDMLGLRSKICSLFNFTADANLMLRYVDEDGDLVTLVDDDDLHDVLRQHLKFLRIDVHMGNDKKKKKEKKNTGSSGSATPLRSPPVPNPFPSGNVAKVDVLHSIQEPLSVALKNLSLSKDASSSPMLVNLADSIFKMGLSILSSHRQPHVAAGPSSKNGVPEESITSEARGQQSPSVDSASTACLDARSSGSDTPLRSPPVSNPFPSGNVTKVDEPLPMALSNLLFSEASSSGPVLHLADSIPRMGQFILNSHLAACPSSKTSVPDESVTSEANDLQSPCVGSASNPNLQVEAGNVNTGVVAGVAPVDLNTLPCDPHSSQSTKVNSDPLSSADDGRKGKVSTDDRLACKCESCRASTSTASHNNSSTQTTAMSPSASIDCSFPGTYTIVHSVVPNNRIPSSKRSYSHTEVMSGMFHKGVRCDGCGVYPITGPRFKSKVKENYDLCSICFNEMGNQTDYIRMDRPVSVRASSRVPRCVNEHTPKFPTFPLHTLKTGAILKHAKPKLDSRFILDVNVIDGTMMAPSTAFTKIWRMRNNGTLVWPKGTQLVWIGGEKFSDSYSVDLEVPENGIPVEKEVDIAVDFIAPQLPGRYISYWRMASPYGHKFGQRVWVLIQVDASLKDSFYDSSQGLNLNIPLGVSGSKGPQIIDINVQPVDDDTFLQPHNPSAPTVPVNQMVDKEPRQELENELAINEATSVGPAASLPATSATPSSVSYPIIDFSETAPAVPSNQPSSAVDAPSSSLGIGGNNSVEETLLKELEEMGFMEFDLNKEILRMNEYNLEQSVDDLCGVSEWDPILEELQEMGFRDKEVNKRLLKKNNGSIKLVVMDLINGE